MSTGKLAQSFVRQSAKKKTPKSSFRKRDRTSAVVDPSFPHELELPAAPKVLISRMSAIGDTILTLPVACAIRDRFPTAEISWIVEEKSAPMV
ncbi:MAG: hypothetical protein AAF802_23865, partial [Planctomycetota bacterium]